MSTITEKTSWNLKSLETDFVKEREIIETETEKLEAKFREDNSYLNDPQALKEALDAFNIFLEKYAGGGNEAYYYWLKSSLDMTDPEVKAKMNQVNDFATRISSKLSFFDINLSHISEEKQQEFLASPLLAEYKHYLERLFRSSKHILSQGEEKIMSMKSHTAFGAWVDMLSEFLSKEERIVLDEEEKESKKNFNEIISLLNNTKKSVRDKAAEAFNDILNKHREIAEAEFNAVLENKKVNDEIRGYSYPEESRMLDDDIDIDTVNAVIDEVSSRFDISRRYYELKSKLFGVEKLGYHERNVMYGSLSDKYTFEEGFNLVRKELGALDTEFSDIMDKFLNDGSYDVYPKKGKTSGAFCMHYLKSQPTYILLNYDDTLQQVLTLAHETGHGINNELMRKKQIATNFATFISTAEVASTFMEDFALQPLLKNADDEERLAIMMHKLNDDISTIFRQVSLFLCERELHHEYRVKGYLTAEEIGKIFSKHMFAYMGDFVSNDPGSENWWIYWSHLRYYFYVYSYASGLLISKAMQHMVKTNPADISKVKEFLSSGSSSSPKDVFSKINIDITSRIFWRQGVEEVESLLNDAERLAKSLGKA